MKHLKNHPNFIILFSAFIIFGIFSIGIGKEISWDMCNYHYYNAYAFLHANHHFDYWPTSFFHQYMNPFLDLSTYALINNFNDLTVLFLQGGLHGIAFFLVYLISLPFIDAKHHKGMALFLAMLGVFSPIILSSIGSFCNDMIVSIFVLLFVLSITRQSLQNINKSLFLLGSISLGIGIGLKYTAACFYVGAFFACCCLSLNVKKRFRLIFLLSVGVGIGVLITAGYWMLLMWQKHHNPLFPYFNNIFLSPEFTITHLRDTRYIPKNLGEHLMFPITFSFHGQRIIEASLHDFRDFRFAILYLLFLIYFFTNRFRDEKNQGKNWLFSFLFFPTSHGKYIFQLAAI